ncbi:MAG: rRNA adenine N-6-methyltransferase family protein [archaeon]
MFAFLHESGRVYLGTGEINTKYGKVKATGPGEVFSDKGEKFIVFELCLSDKIQKMKRLARPIYEHDAGLIAGLLNIGVGKKVLEAGTGSGIMAMCLANFGANVWSYEKREDFYEQAKERLANYPNIRLFNKDVSECEEENFDAIFLDLQNPDNVIPKIIQKLKLGHFIGCYTPIFDDVPKIWRAFQERCVSINAIQIHLQKILVKKYARYDQKVFGFPGFFIWARRFR